ncbi:MAG: hybrid sensor histidine kinase/response regulator [Pseudomonadota bacterium]
MTVAFVNYIADLASSRVHKYGAQYNTFAIFIIINHPLAYLYEALALHSHVSLGFRAIATLLGVGLLLRKQWPSSFKKFLPLYWYMTVIVAIPLLTSYIALKSNLSLELMINFNIATIITLLLVDVLSFVIIEIIGVILGIGLFYALGGVITEWPSERYVSLCSYMFVHVVVVGAIFSRNREIWNDFMNKARDDLNAHLEDAVHTRTLELENALAFKTEYLSNMSHEIRTPVHNFMSLSESLVSQWESLSNEKKLSIAGQVASNAKRLTNLVNNTLDLSKHEAGKWVLHITKFDISSSVSEIIDECQNLYLFQRNIEISFTTEGEMPITADRELTFQVIRNLCTNAIKFCPKEGGRLEASLRIETEDLEEFTPSQASGNPQADGEQSAPKDNRYLHFSLRDNGVGIPPKELVVIFEAFKQSSRTKTGAGGTGLGLALCTKIIKMHHGRIWAENNADGIGSTFHFQLPMCYDENREPLPEREILEDEYMDNKTRPKAILVIDDEENIISSLDLIFAKEGYTIHGYTNAMEGVNYLRKNIKDIDLILLDLMMPDMDGADVMALLKLNPKTSHIPVILQSGTAGGGDLDRAMELGPICYIKKPYANDEILNLVKNAIDKDLGK